MASSATVLPFNPNVPLPKIVPSSVKLPSGCEVAWLTVNVPPSLTPPRLPGSVVVPSSAYFSQ